MILLQGSGNIAQYRYSIFPSGEEGLWSSLAEAHWKTGTRGEIFLDRETGRNLRAVWREEVEDMRKRGQSCQVERVGKLFFIPM